MGRSVCKSLPISRLTGLPTSTRTCPSVSQFFLRPSADCLLSRSHAQHICPVAARACKDDVAKLCKDVSDARNPGSVILCLRCAGPVVQLRYMVKPVNAEHRGFCSIYVCNAQEVCTQHCSMYDRSECSKQDMHQGPRVDLANLAYLPCWLLSLMSSWGLHT